MQSIIENRTDRPFSVMLQCLSTRQDVLTQDVVVLPLITTVLV
jgi:hypothetical protein